MQDEYHRYQRIEQELMQQIHTVERATAQLTLIPAEERERMQEQIDTIVALRTTIRAAILTAEELLTPVQLQRLQRRVNVHDPHRWHLYRSYQRPF